MVRSTSARKPILNNVPTWLPRTRRPRQYVLDHLPELVVKEVHGAGGYGMLVGPAAKAEIEDFRQRILRRPENYIAQPTLSCRPPARPSSTASRRATSTCALRAVGRTRVQMVPGGLTRVALKEGSLVVNRRRAAAPRTPGFWGQSDQPFELPQTTSSGWRATPSAPRTPRACSTSYQTSLLPRANGGEPAGPPCCRSAS